MNKFIGFKEAMALGVIRRAKELAWAKLSKEEQDLLLKQAEEEQWEDMKKLAMKSVEDAEKAFSEPGFVSRADPRAYSDHPESETAKQKRRGKK